MSDLSGFGMWVWQLLRCERGSKEEMVRRAKACGIKWIAIKAGESHPNGQLKREVVEFFRANDIEVAAWWYSRPSTTDAELRMVEALVKNHGVQHLIMDAEIEWETVKVGTVRLPHNFKRQAAEYAQELRKKVGPDVFLADAPWAKPKSHPLFPFAEFGAVMDMRMPQFYWMLAKERLDAYLPECEKQWAASFNGSNGPHPPVCPIGSAVDFTGAKHAPLETVSKFLEWYKDSPAFSFWSWQHIDILEWKTFEEHHKKQCLRG